MHFPMSRLPHVKKRQRNCPNYLPADTVNEQIIGGTLSSDETMALPAIEPIHRRPSALYLTRTIAAEQIRAADDISSGVKKIFTKGHASKVSGQPTRQK